MELSIDFVKQLKQHILASRYLVAKMANAESLRLYFAIGQDLDTEIKHNAWGDKILDSVAARLQQELPGLRGLSASNIRKMRLFYQAWNLSAVIGSSVTNQLDSSAVHSFLPTVSDKLNTAHQNSDTPCPMPKPLKN